MASSYSSILKPGGETLNRLYSQLKGFQLVGGSTSIPPSTYPKLRQYSQSLSLLNLTLKPTRNASLLPIIKAQGSPGMYSTNIPIALQSLLFAEYYSLYYFLIGCYLDYFPDANFYKVEAILRSFLCLLYFSIFLFSLNLISIFLLLTFLWLLHSQSFPFHSLKFHSLTFGMSNSFCCFCFQQQTRPWRIPQVSSVRPTQSWPLSYAYVVASLILEHHESIDKFMSKTKKQSFSE